MTRERALARIDDLAADPAAQISPDCVADAKRLIQMLPLAPLEALQWGWVRIDPRRPGQIDLFWSKAENFFEAGNRILSIATLGQGEFAVEMSNPFAVPWQRSADGRAVADRLSFNQPDPAGLLARLTSWQLS